MEIGVRTNIARAVVRNAEATPDAVAISAFGKDISYREYCLSASRLASAMSSEGMGREDRVLVFLDPDETVPIALLAILMIGAVYVPLDPSWPANRIQAIVDDVTPGWVVTNSNALAKLPTLSGARIFCADQEVLSLSSTEACFEPVPVLRDDAAYIFYTSGTTGTPKGVVLTYGNLHFYMESAASQYRFAPDDRHLAIAKFTFSISLFDLLLPFVCGGALFLRARDDLMNPAKLAQLIRVVTCFHMGPALLGAFLRHAAEEKLTFPSIRHVSSGGDMVPAELLQACKAVFPLAEIWVIYGCTEVACMGLTWQVDRATETTTTFVGKAFPHARVKLRDEQGEVVSQGNVGEVCFAGDGVAREYLNRPSLNAEKFITIDGERYYTTGDLGVASTEGNIRLLGRKDYQVKINGVRIEVEEIEHWLRQSEGVVAANVVGATNHRGERNIAAFVVMSNGFEFSSEKLRRFLSQHLPDYMIPSWIFSLDKMPLNINLKLDRQALIKLADENISQVRAVGQFDDQLTGKLARLWADCGTSSSVTEASNFFEVGGDSLGAAELAFKASRTFSVSMEISDIYDAPTLGQQVEYIREASAGSSQRKNTCLAVSLSSAAASSGQPFFIVPGLGGHVVSFQDFGANLAPRWRAYGLLYPAFLGEEFDTIESVAERMLKDVRSVQSHGPYYLSGYSMGGFVSLEIARLLREQGEVANLVLLEARIFELAPTKPLIRRLPVYVEGKLRTLLARAFNKRKPLLLNSLLSAINGDAAEKSFPPQVQLAFESGRTQMANYRLTPCDAQAVLVKCEGVAWWDKLRIWLNDYGWSRYVNLVDILYAPGDHLDMVRQKDNHPSLAIALEKAFAQLQGNGRSEVKQDKSTA